MSDTINIYPTFSKEFSMSPQVYSIFIPKGTIVAGKDKASSFLVNLVGDVFIDNASRHDDGAYAYSIGSTVYVASSSTVRVIQ